MKVEMNVEDIMVVSRIIPAVWAIAIEILESKIAWVKDEKEEDTYIAKLMSPIQWRDLLTKIANTKIRIKEERDLAVDLVMDIFLHEDAPDKLWWYIDNKNNVNIEEINCSIIDKCLNRNKHEIGQF